ncbi:acyltransferase family protein [Arenimonas sp. MALMAid1274]|uniref:acyltransferase family protein n=1 Tax=Arenimonas sp. MALMAid1274 TaxID=3411630 RepID=UPI003B9ECA07
MASSAVLPGAPSAGPRLEFLDSLRGLAAVYVVVYHMLLIPQPALLAPLWAEKFAHSGGNGVVMFFIVSAFSLYYTMPMRERDSRPVLSFYLHRFFRIAPLFYLLIPLSLLRDWLAFGVLHSPWEVLASVLFVFNLVPGGEEGFVWASWTIGIEMVFYAVFPLVYYRIRQLSTAIAFFFACILGWMAVQLALEYLLLPPEWKASMLQWNALKYFPTFALGVVLYFTFMRSHATAGDTAERRGVGAALLLGGLFAYCAMLQGWLPGVFGTAYAWPGVVCAILAIGLALCPTRLMVNRATAYLGKVSYSVYLLHPTLVYFLIPVYRRIYAEAGNLSLAFLASLALTLAILLPLSSLTYRWIEKPGIQFGRRIASRWSPRTPIQNAPAVAPVPETSR